MDIPIPPDFSNNILQEGRPVIKNGVITSTDILSANSFEDKVAIACTLSQPIVSQAELQAWKLYVIDLKQARFLIDLAPAVNTAVIAAVNAAVGPAVIAAVNAAVGPAVNVAMQPFVRRLAMTHNRIAFLETINGSLLEVSNTTGDLPGPLFPKTVAEFEVFTDEQLDALIEFYRIGPVFGGRCAKQMLLRPVFGDYRSLF